MKWSHIRELSGRVLVSLFFTTSGLGKIINQVPPREFILQSLELSIESYSLIDTSILLLGFVEILLGLLLIY